jgi:hypothetical protein
VGSLETFKGSHVTAPAWTIPRVITIHITGSKLEPPARLSLRVTPEQREEFTKVFEAYLYFCAQAKSTVRLRDEIIDVDTGELCAITVELVGERNVIIPEFQRISQMLMKYSTVENRP